MAIKVTHGEVRSKFVDLLYGTFYEYQGEYYIRTKPNSSGQNCVNISTGECGFTGSDTLVEKLPPGTKIEVL